MKLGRELAAEVDRQAKFVDDPVITEYVNRVGQNIVLHSDAKIPFTIKVIDSDEVNAFALPGGFFYVNKGLILVADNEAEVAGVMAHEIAPCCRPSRPGEPDQSFSARVPGDGHVDLSRRHSGNDLSEHCRPWDAGNLHEV